MSVQEISCGSSFLEEENSESGPLLEMRPFYALEDDSEDEIVRDDRQDNPFAVHSESKEKRGSLKTDGIVFKNRVFSNRTVPKRALSGESTVGGLRGTQIERSQDEKRACSRLVPLENSPNEHSGGSSFFNELTHGEEQAPEDGNVGLDTARAHGRNTMSTVLSDKFLSSDELELSAEKIVSLGKRSWTKESFRLVSDASLVRSAEYTETSRMKNGEHITLPVAGRGKSDNIMRISTETAAALIKGIYKRDCVFVDARYRYEYEGGHIRGAIRLETECEMRDLLSLGKLVVFYCEFSSVRGPSLALKLRSLDRQTSKYPELRCPEIYVLEGGYRKFFMKYSMECTPSSYVTMDNEGYRYEHSQEHRVKRLRKI